MATNGFTSIQVSDTANSLVEQLQTRIGGQKRDLISNLLIGLLISDPEILNTILNVGRMAAPTFAAGVQPLLCDGINFPKSHFMSGHSERFTLEKLVTSANSWVDENKPTSEDTKTMEGETPKRKGK